MFKKSVQDRINTCHKNFDTLEEAKAYYEYILNNNPDMPKSTNEVFKAYLKHINELIKVV